MRSAGHQKEEVDPPRKVPSCLMKGGAGHLREAVTVQQQRLEDQAVRSGMDKGDPALQHKHILGCLRSYTTCFSIASIKVCGKGLEEGGPATRMRKQRSAVSLLTLSFS